MILIYTIITFKYFYSSNNNYNAMIKIVIYIILFASFTTNAQVNKNDPDLLKKYTKALKSYNKENDSVKNPAQYYYKRGGIRQDYFDLEGAVTDYSKTIYFSPDYVKAWYNRGLAKLDLSLLKEAERDFDRAIDLDPKNVHAYNNRGICKDYMQNFPGAIRDYSAAIELDSTYAEAYNNRGISKIKMGQNDEGCEDLHKAMKLGDKKSERNIKKLCDKK